MRTLSLLAGLLASCGVMATALAAPDGPPLPTNDINCKDWTHNPDGSWSSGPNTPHMRNDRLFPGVHVVTTTKTGSSYDLLDVLEKKCGKGR